MNQNDEAELKALRALKEEGGFVIHQGRWQVKPLGHEGFFPVAKLQDALLEMKSATREAFKRHLLADCLGGEVDALMPAMRKIEKALHPYHPADLARECPVTVIRSASAPRHIDDDDENPPGPDRDPNNRSPA